MDHGSPLEERPRVTLTGILPLPDRRSLIIYMLYGGMIPFTFLCLHLTAVQLADSLTWSLEILAGLLIFVAWMLRRAGHTRISSAMETITLMFIKGSFVLVLQYPMIALSGPFADAWLLEADRFLGFDWLSFARLFNGPISFAVLEFAYRSMMWQAIVLLILMCATSRETRAWQLVTAAVIALTATILIFPFFPADGAYVLCGLKAPDVPVMDGFCDYSLVMHLIKDEGVRTITTSMHAGMIAFPSFHTVAALLLFWGAWTYRWLRVPATVLNLLMLVATIIVGGHYLIDVVAGLAIAVAAIWLATRLVGDAPRHKPAYSIQAAKPLQA